MTRFFPILFYLLLIIILTGLYILLISYLNIGEGTQTELIYIMTFIFGMIIMGLITSFIKELGNINTRSFNNGQFPNIKEIKRVQDGKLIFTDEDTSWRTKGYLFPEKEENED